MDPKGRDEMLELVRDLAHNKGVNLILSSHLLPDVEYTCDSVVVMDKGRIAAQGADRRAEAAARPRVRAAREDAAGELDRSSTRLRAAGLECHATDEDVMRVFVPGEAARASCSRSPPPSGVQVRHLRPSVPTLEDVFAHAVGTRTEARVNGPHRHAYPRSGLSAVRRHARRRAARVDGHRPAGIRTCSRKRAFLGLLLISWLPFFVRAVQIYAAANLPQAAFLAPTRRDVPAVPRAAGDLRVLHDRLRGRRPDRQRSARQRAADLSVEAADARRVHVRQARRS